MDSSFRLPVKFSFALFCLAVVFFVVLGPVRALHGFYSYDFASLYGATQSWAKGLNPYDMDLVAALVHRAGYDSASYPNYLPVQPSVYLPTSFPLLALLTWLPWEPARLLWALLAAGLFAWSILLLVSRTAGTDRNTKWLVLAFVFCFTPVALGLSHGNPSVLACSLTMLAVYGAMNNRSGWAALALGVVHCIKPQISIAVLVLFVLWGYWRPLLLSFVCPAVVSIISVLRAPSIAEFSHWVVSLQQAIAAASTPGSINDPSPANDWGAYSMVNAQTLFAIWVHSPIVMNLLVWAMALGLAGCYLTFRSRLQGDKRARDMAFFSALTLLIVYHRFYDEQLLLMVVPFLLTINGTRRAGSVALWAAMLLLSFPIHVGSDHFRKSLHSDTFIGLLVLRPLPLIVLGICVLLIPWATAAGREATTAPAEIAKTRVAGR